MANYTENYDLILPEDSDPYNVEDMNTNFAAVDAALYANEQAMADAGEKIDAVGSKVDAVGSKVDTANNRIGSSGSTGTSTLFGQLNNIRSTLAGGSSPIKSIQHLVKDYNYTNKEATLTLNAVNPSKCIVIMERLYDTSTFHAKVEYTLSSTSLVTVVNRNGNACDATIGFWIIEFN